MGTTTTTFALNKPTVGGDDNAWGTDLNANADKLDDLLDGTTAIKPNLSEGLWKVGGVAVTATAAELNILDGVTASAAEINILDGVTASTAELNILDGATLTVTELNYVDGVTSAIQAQLDAKYDSGDIASQAEAEAGTDNTKVMTPLRVAQAARPVLGTDVASTSGTSIDFTGIPAWANRVTIMFSDVSTNNTSTLLIQIGDSGGIETTGYTSASGNIFGTTVASASSTAGFVFNSALPANILSGAIVLSRRNGNTWVCSGQIGTTVGTVQTITSTGTKTLSATLDRVRVTTSGGADTFDGGNINVSWE